ncbi:unnamed protein product [Prorocentrum cordatum]|uniref:Thioredoxin domain-containing protein n=1 Tax=Prorocentrum cordatum TaxID=2364126 RepID=A0ABN9TYD9_9DINO|nr:unnamed protein product [Polarella glacialis]
MPKQTPKKPAGVKAKQAVPSWALKFGASTLVTGAVIYLSVLVSPQESKVTVLNDKSFHKFLAEHKDGALVEFSKKGCTFCTKLAPAYEGAARRSADEGGPAFAIVDSEASPKVIEALGIDKYPMVYWFWGGENTLELERAAEKTADDIVDFVKWAQSPALQLLDTRAEMEEGLPLFRQSLAKDHKLIVAYNRTDSPLLHDVFEYAAQKHRASHILFLFVREAAADGALARAYGQNESLDAELSEWKGRDDVLSWVKIQVDEVALKGLEKKIEVNKAKLAELKREEEEKASATSEL